MVFNKSILTHLNVVLVCIVRILIKDVKILSLTRLDSSFKLVFVQFRHIDRQVEI